MSCPTGENLTRASFRVFEQIFPQIIITLLFRELDSLGRKLKNTIDPMFEWAYSADISKPLDDERKRLFVVPHPAK